MRYARQHYRQGSEWTLQLPLAEIRSLRCWLGCSSWVNSSQRDSSNNNDSLKWRAFQNGGKLIYYIRMISPEWLYTT
jgi:hypothetical protein